VVTPPASNGRRERAWSFCLLTADPCPHSVLPALSLLGHGGAVRRHRRLPPCLTPARTTRYWSMPARDLAGSRSLCRLLGSTGLDVPVVVVIGEGGLVALSADWGSDEILLPTAGPAEVDARLRLLIRSPGHRVRRGSRQLLVLGELVIDEATYTARLKGRPLDLTYKEFELLKYLAQHAGRVFTPRRNCLAGGMGL